jgi:hypothetical protein
MNLFRICSSVVFILAAQSVLSAQNTVSEVVGFVTTTIAPSSNGRTFATTPVSPTLLQASAVNGITSGHISAVAPKAVWVTSAGWTTNQLSSSQTYLLVKSGNLEGLMLRITSNTADSANVDTQGVDLVKEGLSAGNSFQLVEGDTLLSLFGTAAHGVIGGTSKDFSRRKTDRVSLRDASGLVRTYYFNTTFQQWRRLGSNADQGLVPISPYAGAFYARIGRTPLEYLSIGNVPTSPVKVVVPAKGTTYLGRVYPSDGKIQDFGLDKLPGWKTSNVFGRRADRLRTTDTSGVLRSYVHNGQDWRRPGVAGIQSETPVKIGGAVSIFRNAASSRILEIPLPYSL